MFVKLLLRLLKDPLPYESSEATAMGHAPTIEALQDLQQHGSYRTAARYLNAEGDSASRQLCFDVLGRDTPRNDVVMEWVRQRPMDAHAHVVAGLQAIRLAWKSRSGARARHVREDQWRGFADYLYLAQEVLDHAVKLAPNEPMAHACLITVDCGMGRSTEVSMGRMARIRKSDPTHFTGYSNLLMNCCEKWCGSHELMFEIARSPNLAKPGRENLGALIPMAHLERTLFESGRVRRAYWAKPEVASEVAEAFDRGIGKTGFQGDALSPIAANTFAGVFHVLRDRERCRQSHRVLAGHFHDRSWLYMGGKRAFEASRKWCGS